MRIAINTRFLLTSKMEGFGWYTFEICKRLVEKHPEHSFIFFFDRKYDPKFIFGKNVIPVVLRPQARHPILHYLWFEFAVTKALKKYQADVFFSPDGYLSLRTNVPQINTIHDLNFEHFPQDLPYLVRKYYRYFFPKFARKASKIITVSEFSKQDICNTYDIPENKVTAVWNGVSGQYAVLDEKSCLTVRNEYSAGNKYFIFVGSLNPRKNLKRLIEAFQIYKSKFPDGYDLVIVGSNMWSSQNQNLNILSQFKNNIHFTGHLSLENLTQVMGAASCMTFVPYFEGFGIPLVEAMKCGVPIISGNRTSLPEILGDAGILVDPFSVKEIANAMELIYLDENLQNELSEKGLERAKLFSWDKSAEALWEEIVSVEKNAKGLTR
ncbi:MAG: glycosyltransferase family 4 protein [Flavobacteriia bacterium]